MTVALNNISPSLNASTDVNNSKEAEKPVCDDAHEANCNQNSPYAIAQYIFNCSIAKRLRIYALLLIEENEISDFEKLHAGDPENFILVVNDQIKCYADFCFTTPEEALSQIISALNDDRNDEKLAYQLDANLEPLRDVALFLQNKKGVETLAAAVAGKKLGEMKRILRQTGKFQYFDQIQTVAEAILGNSVENIAKTLFQGLYKRSFEEEKLRSIDTLQKFHSEDILLQGSIDDPTTLDGINDLLTRSINEINRENGEKSLDQLCHEYVHYNPDSMSVPVIKGHIANIRLYIADLKNQRSLPDTSNQAFPLAQIAQICVAIERNFNVMLRDSQLLAILALLDTGNLKGSLLEVKTGEGKSYIIAALAIIKSTQGHEIDVITSSSTLAKRDAENFKAFYQQFGISSSHNCDPDKGLMANPCYQPHSIVYGTPASFQGDGLRSEFYQAETFNGRKRGIAIFDEVDSMLLDKAGWLCQISDSVAGMSTLRPLLYYIWALVAKKVVECEQSKRALNSQADYDAFIQEIRREANSNAHAFFASGDHGFAIPSHLKSFVEFRIPFWVDSAINAITYSPDREYNAASDKITPIDNANTGEWEKEVQWEDGLHQFLHMKHGIKIPTETLTKSFMSNLTLAGKYEKFYGLSGTLGHQAEAETLSSVYGVSTRKIPTFKTSRFSEKPAWVATDHAKWLNSLYMDVVTDGREDEAPANNVRAEERQRASLVICNSIADVNTIKAYFLQQGISSEEIVTYTHGDDDREKIKHATKGKVIIATNLSGRGTDIDAETIEAVGGMHVIFSFLPINRRIQDQGFGRTARTGRSGTGRLIIKSDELRPYHMGEKSVKPLLDICNDMRYSNLKGSEISYNGSSWIVDSDLFGATRSLKLKNRSDSSATVTVELTHSPQLHSEGQNQTYNSITVDGVSVNNQTLHFCTPELTYASILHGRNQRELQRLYHLKTHERIELASKQADFEIFQECYHNIAQNFQVDPRLESIKDHLLEIYKLYLLDEWAIALDKSSKTSQKFDVRAFVNSRSLNHMIQENDLYKMQYINASINVDDQSIREEADKYYAERSTKVDMTGGFAAYNRVFVQLVNNKHDINLAKASLESARKIFEEGEQHEMRLLNIQRQLSAVDTPPENGEVESTPMLRLILTMKALIKRNLEEIDSLRKDYDKLKVSFTSPYDLKEKPSGEAQKKESDEKAYTIPDELMQDAIKLGLKGCLKLEGEGTQWQAILLAVVCALVAIAAIAAVALSGGVAAPLVGLLGGKIMFGIITSTIIGGAISGAINAIKGAVRGDFSLSQFGKDIAVGLATGLVGGGIGAGLSSVCAVTLQTAGTAARVGIQTGIGAISGGGAGVTNYLVSSGIHGRKVTTEGFGKSFLLGAAGGGISGGLSGIMPNGTNNVFISMGRSGVSGAASNSVKQGINMALNGQQYFDGFQLLESVGGDVLKSGGIQGAKNFAGRQSQQVARQTPAQASEDQDRRLEALRNMAARGTSPERVRANNRLVQLGHPPVQAMPGPVPQEVVPRAPSNLPSLNLQVSTNRNSSLHSSFSPGLLSIHLPQSENSVGRAGENFGWHTPFGQSDAIFINGPVRTGLRHPFAQGDLSRSRSMDDHLNVTPNFQMHADGRAIDNYPPPSITPMGIYRNDKARWDAWYQNHAEFLKAAQLTKFHIMTAMATWEKWKNESKVMQQLVNQPNDKKLGISRVHVLEGYLEGYCSIDVSPVRGNPGEWRLLCKLAPASKSKTDFSRSKPIALVDTHGLLTKHLELQGREGLEGVVQIDNLGRSEVSLTPGTRGQKVNKWNMKGILL